MFKTSFDHSANLAINIRLLLASWIVVLVVSVSSGLEPHSIRLNDQTLIKFVSVEEGQELIGATDDFTERLGDLEIQLRLESSEPVSKQEFLKRMRAEVVEWNSRDIEVVENSVETLRDRMQAYRLPFPEQIHLIRVSNRVEQNAPHCRRTSVVLPDAFFKKQKKNAQVLAHELFHVLSSQNPELRDRLYQIIHFERSNKISLPETLQDQRLTNPDAPVNEHVIHLMVDGNKTPAAPVILAKSKTFRPGGVFANMDFKIMLLERKNGDFVARFSEGQPQLLSPREVPDYLDQIGRNTGYIIHPEETLADNFWMMLLGSDRIQDPWVIEQMRSVLAK